MVYGCFRFFYIVFISMPIFHTILSTLFPDSCVGCGRSGTLLCAECARKIPPAPSPEHDFITSVFAYRDFRIRALVRMLKYKNARHASAVFAPYLAAALAEFVGEEGNFLGSGPTLLVPVPLSKKRRKERGYNQAELLVRGMLRHMPKGSAVLGNDILKKVVETGKQADITKRSVRLASLGDCFRASPEKAKEYAGRTIVLVDDVTTTGATLLAAHKALRAAGFKKVHALTVAY